MNLLPESLVRADFNDTAEFQVVGHVNSVTVIRSHLATVGPIWRTRDFSVELT